ncbi:hypothetical protein KY329_03015 [Candidatus Woesearchaeota archaeon]|nr:hypothetical protein [Candidatus Woesearchaeota archaeon]
MRKLLFFVVASIFALSLLSIKGATGYAVAEVSMGNFGISMIGLILFAFVLALFTFKTSKSSPIQSTVWDELEEAEEEWQRKRGR